MGLYAVNRNDNAMTEVTPATFREIGAGERRDLQEWIAKNPDCLCQDDGEEREKLRIIQTEADNDNDELDRFPIRAGLSDYHGDFSVREPGVLRCQQGHVVLLQHSQN